MKTIIHIFILTGILLLSGCADNWLKEDMPHLITTETLYTSYEGLETGINGLYSLARREREGRSGSNNMIADMFMNGTDNLVTNHRDVGFSMISEVWGSLNNAENIETTGIFFWLYEIVNAANTIINYAENEDINWTTGPGTVEENKNRILSDAKFIRAWAYRHLTFCWGDVPLNLDISIGSNIRTDWERTPILEVRRFILAELLYAQKHIPVEANMVGRITKGGVQHYIAEMYLVLNKPDSALYWADQTINTPAYKLITQRYGVRADRPGVPIMDMFYEGNENREQGNTEALWVFQFELQTTGGGTGLMRRHHVSRYSEINIGGVRAIQDTYERGGRGRSRMSLTKWAIEHYEPQDDRASEYAMRKFFILKNAEENAPYAADLLPPGYNYGDTVWLDWSNDITYATRARLNWPFLRKAEGTDPLNVAVEGQWNDQVYLRLADTYLLKAEALYLLGRIEDSAETLNIIRRRSNASEITAADVDIDFILDERSRELLLEEHRRYTLLRTGKWMERTRAYNHNGGDLITERDLLFPIPQSVINSNLTKVMPQNPGFN